MFCYCENGSCTSPCLGSLNLWGIAAKLQSERTSETGRREWRKRRAQSAWPPIKQPQASSAWDQVTTKVRMLFIEVVAISCNVTNGKTHFRSSNHLWFHVHLFQLQTNLKRAETERLQGVFIASCLVYEQQGWRASRVKKHAESHCAHWQIRLVGQCHWRVWICLDATFEDWDFLIFPASSLFPIHSSTKLRYKKSPLQLRIFPSYRSNMKPKTLILHTVCGTPGQSLALLGHPSPPERDPESTNPAAGTQKLVGWNSMFLLLKTGWYFQVNLPLTPGCIWARFWHWHSATTWMSQKVNKWLGSMGYFTYLYSGYSLGI